MWPWSFFISGKSDNSSYNPFTEHISSPASAEMLADARTDTMISALRAGMQFNTADGNKGAGALPDWLTIGRLYYCIEVPVCHDFQSL